MRRPKFPRTDANHKIVSEVLSALDYRYGGEIFHLIDTSKQGGNLVDWLLICRGNTYYVEVKIPQERNSLTQGEAETMSWEVPFYIVTTREDVMDMLYNIARDFPSRDY